MKRFILLLFLCIITSVIVAGCGSKLKEVNFKLDKKHSPLPNYVLNSSQKVKETYILASKYPKVLASVPCFCGCKSDGHKNDLDCFVKKMGSNNAVEEWDPHGQTCDTCIDIARDSVEMHLDGKDPKKIYHLITEKYKDVGEPTPTPAPK